MACSSRKSVRTSNGPRVMARAHPRRLRISGAHEHGQVGYEGKNSSAKSTTPASAGTTRSSGSSSVHRGS